MWKAEKLSHATSDQKWAGWLARIRKNSIKRALKKEKGYYVMIKILTNQEDIKLKTCIYT